MSHWLKLKSRIYNLFVLIVRSIPDECGGVRLRYYVYRKLFTESKSHFNLSANVVITGYSKIKIGKNSSIMSGGKLYAHNSKGIVIGSFCSFNHNVLVDSAD